MLFKLVLIRNSSSVSIFLVHKVINNYNNLLQKSPLLQVSPQVLFFSLFSTLASLAVLAIAIYLIRTRKNQSYEPNPVLKVPSDYHELFLLTKDWGPDQHRTLLSHLLLEDEYAILEVLVVGLKEDGVQLIDVGENPDVAVDKGWKNKHQLTTESGLSTRRVYAKNGIVERLVALNLAEIRKAPSDWGRQTNQYRANTSHSLVMSMFSTLHD